MFWLCFVAVWGLQEPPQPSLASRQTSLRIYSSQRVEIYYTGDFTPHVGPLAHKVDFFLADLEKRWTIIFPKTKVKITLAKFSPAEDSWIHFEGPPWLKSYYEPTYYRIHLMVSRPSRFRLDPVLRALKHRLVHHLLNHNRENPLPPYLEEGLAQYYTQPQTSNDRYLALWGFFRNPELGDFLLDDEIFRSPETFYYGAALSRLFVDWLWETRPSGEPVFFQSFFRGNPVDLSLKAAGFSPADDLIARFDQAARPLHKPYTILYTLDFWLIFVGLFILVYSLWKVIAAVRTARLPFLEIAQAIRVEAEVKPEHFTGPAFGGGSAAHVRPVDGIMLEQEEWSGAALVDLSSPEGAPLLVQDPPPSNPTPLSPAPVTASALERVIDGDVEDAFSNLLPSANAGGPAVLSRNGGKEDETEPILPPKAPAQTRAVKGLGALQGELDEDLDELFGSWKLSPSATEPRRSKKKNDGS